MELPQFERATRRTFLRRGLTATGLLAAGGLLAACSKSDADAFASAPTDDSGTTPSSRATTPTTAGEPAATAEPTTTTAARSSGGTSAAARPAEIAFSYTASDASGRVRNPYLAAWLEDERSQMVALISVWYDAREAKYLRELTEFAGSVAEVSSDQVDAVTGATRSAGRYQLQWDGRGLDGSALVGTYTLWIEAAREHGPHSVVSGTLTAGQAGSTTIPGSGELSDAEVRVA